MQGCSTMWGRVCSGSAPASAQHRWQVATAPACPDALKLVVGAATTGRSNHRTCPGCLYYQW